MDSLVAVVDVRNRFKISIVVEPAFLTWYYFSLSSTAGQEVINKVTLESRQAGRDREEIQAEQLEEAIADAVYNNKNSKCATLYNTDQIQILGF